MDYFDIIKFKFAFPWFYTNLPKDIIMEILDKIPKKNHYPIKFKMDCGKTYFDNSFDIFNYETKIKILQLTIEKYPDLTDQIKQIGKDLNLQFPEITYCHAECSIPSIYLKNMDITKLDDANYNLDFTMNVLKCDKNKQMEHSNIIFSL